MNQETYITCEQLSEFLADYIDGTLPEPQRAEFERHMGVCPPCVRYLESYRRTIALTREALGPADAPLPATIPEGIVAAVRAACRAQREST